MENSDLNKFLNALEDNIQNLNDEVNQAKGRLGQHYFAIKQYNDNLQHNLDSMRLFFDINTNSDHEEISLKALNAKIQKFISNINISKLSIISESEIITSDKNVLFNEMKLNTLLNCLVENATAAGATTLYFTFTNHTDSMGLTIANNGRVEDKNKSAPFQKIGHKLILKLCKQLAYDVDFIKSNKAMITKIKFS